jgi:hypothetical protein
MVNRLLGTQFKVKLQELHNMKKFALLLVIVAFGAAFIAGCPTKNNTSTTNTTDNAPANGNTAK